MSGGITVEGDGLRALSADLHAVPERLTRHIWPVVNKGALNIKTTMRADAQASPHFKGIARSIGYDITTASFGGDGVIQSEIGPAHGHGEAGNLANIAYWGGAHGGGGVRDPQAALDEEAPRFEKALYDATEDLL